MSWDEIYRRVPPRIVRKYWLRNVKAPLVDRFCFCHSLKPLDRLTLDSDQSSQDCEGSHNAGAPVDHHVASRLLFHAEHFVPVQDDLCFCQIVND